MNDQRFFDLAMKDLAGHATAAERAELETLVAAHPELQAQREQWRLDGQVAKEVLPLAAATAAEQGKLPAYARERLQTKVRQTLGRPQVAPQPACWQRRWLRALVPVAVLVLGMLLWWSRPAAPVIQLALLDPAGAMRGAATNETALLEQQWRGATVQSFGETAGLVAWESDWPEQLPTLVKVIYDRTAGEVRVVGRQRDRRFEASFLVEPNLKAALAQAARFIEEQLGQGR